MLSLYQNLHYLSENLFIKWIKLSFVSIANLIQLNIDIFYAFEFIRLLTYLQFKYLRFVLTKILQFLNKIIIIFDKKISFSFFNPINLSATNPFNFIYFRSFNTLVCKKTLSKKTPVATTKNVTLKKSSSHNIKFYDFYLNMMHFILIFYFKYLVVV